MLCGTYAKSVYFDDIQMELDLLKDMGNNQKGNVSRPTYLLFLKGPLVAMICASYPPNT